MKGFHQVIKVRTNWLSGKEIVLDDLSGPYSISRMDLQGELWLPIRKEILLLDRIEAAAHATEF